MGRDAFENAGRIYANVHEGEQIIGADVATMDNSFAHCITSHQSAKRMDLFNLEGHPPSSSIAAATEIVLGELPIITPRGRTYKASSRLICSGAFAVQEFRSMRTLTCAVTADLVDYCTNDQPGLSLRRAHVLGDDLVAVCDSLTF